MKRCATLCVIGLLLSACGKPDDGQASAAASKNNTASLGQNVAEDSAPPASNPFSERTYSLNEAMNFDVFGLKLGMSPAEARKALTDKKFAPPPEEQRHGLDTRIVDLGFDCDMPAASPCKPGLAQTKAYYWTRPATDNARAPESILAQFYIDPDLKQKLYAVSYTRFYNPKTDPTKLHQSMVDRFGEPTNGGKPDGLNVFLSYYMQLPVPDSYTPTPDDRRGSAGYKKQRAVNRTRLDCLRDEVHNFELKERTPECATILGGNAQAQHMYDGLIDRPIGNLFLSVQGGADTLRVELVGNFLKYANDQAMEEVSLLKQLDEKKAASERGGGAPADI